MGYTPVIPVRDTIVTVISTIDSTRMPATASVTLTASKASVGPIVGGLIGGISTGLAIIGFVLWFIRWRKNRKEQNRQILEKRRRRLEAKYRTVRCRTATNNSSNWFMSSHARQNPAISKHGLDPTLNVASPLWQRTGQDLQISDPFKPGNCYAYQSQLVQYVVSVSDQDYHHQPPTIVKLLPGGLNNRTDPVSLADTPSSSHSSESGWQGSSASPSSPAPGSRPSVQSTANSEGPFGKADSAATATADQVALSARVNIPSLHRPLRPSPLRRSYTMRRGMVPSS